ncbi:MAG: hypothetical protein P4L84_24435 [Isosphaeraceae bacterium]|nr:hypothetical protein [Isosphaeraceae bacterium]
MEISEECRKNRTAMVRSQDTTEFTHVGELDDEPVTDDCDGPKRPDRMLRQTSGHHGKLP